MSAAKFQDVSLVRIPGTLGSLEEVGYSPFLGKRCVLETVQMDGGGGA